MHRLNPFARTAWASLFALVLATGLYAQVGPGAGSNFCAATSDSTLTSCLTDTNRLLILGQFTGSTPPTTANVFQRGAVLISLTAGVTTTVWTNIGTSAAPVWLRMGSSDSLQEGTCTLTNAQVLALHNTAGAVACTDLAAPGAGKFVEIIDGDMAYDHATAYTGGSPLRFWYTNRSVGPAASSSIAETILTTSADGIVHFTGLPDGSNPPTSNVAVTIMNTTGAAFGGGNASNAVRFYYAYRIRVTGL